MQTSTIEDEDVFFDSFDRTPIDSSPRYSAIDDEQELEFRKLDSEFWKKDVMSVHERRNRFLCDLGLDEFVSSSSIDCSPQTKGCDHMVENLISERISTQDHAEQKEFRDFDNGEKFTIHDHAQEFSFSIPKEVSNKQFSSQEYDSFVGLSCSVQNLSQKEVSPFTGKYNKGLKGSIKKLQSWWRKLIPSIGTCKNDVHIKNPKPPMTIKSKVLRHNKKCLEFTALYVGQEIRAHKGLIRTMKFNSCGYFLASGGEDCIVRIWKVSKAESTCKCEFVGKVNDKKSILGRKCVDSAQVVIPKKVFMIDESPLHEFCGHTSDILDLSWSKTDYLLTSSMDKTVRLWKVGNDGCLKVFPHYDYVPCVQFNPVDNKYFITGSIDGKVRIWDISENHVVDWAEIRDIVTAVCYNPDGEGFVVGTIMGKCRFYKYSGDIMQLETQFQVQGKKKSVGKTITGLQFAPEDSQRVLITSADSRIRIFDGVDVIHKFRGLRKTKRQLSASFTTDGRYIISVGDDSNIYIFNSDLTTAKKLSKDQKPLKSIRSCELFLSKGASIAVPWPGTDRKQCTLKAYNNLQIRSQPVKLLEPSTWLWDANFCSLGAWLFSDTICKGSATWPEEKLLEASKHSLEVKDYTHRHFHRLKHLSATWNMVLVTASSDGVIRSFHNYGLPVRL